ncbi:hypothetical protein [Telmatospirillum sp.]|uniref:hypothetical protein n=1 Tax=Telmatospirillum sp. TaxID=2079197 RepID=UPI00283E8CA2|nr:hypothetical protein [Telmatospirillum sp.]MDR3436521.1 hypothetical protein [Telmatospirillum sp.]
MTSDNEETTSANKVEFIERPLPIKGTGIHARINVGPDDGSGEGFDELILGRILERLTDSTERAALLRAIDSHLTKLKDRKFPALGSAATKLTALIRDTATRACGGNLSCNAVISSVEHTTGLKERHIRSEIARMKKADPAFAKLWASLAHKPGPKPRVAVRREG